MLLIINIYMDFKLKSFGDDDLDCLSIENKLEIFASKCPIRTIIEKINMNPNNPSSHNFLIENANDSHCKIYSKGQWHDANTDEILLLLHYTKIYDLKKIFNELKPYLNNSTINLLTLYFNDQCSKLSIRKKPVDVNKLLKKNVTIDMIENQLKS
jgi:hypothetical protein